MGRTLARALPMVVAFTWMVIFSTCANATTYDIFSFDLKTLIGNKIIGTGTFDVADTTPGIHTLTGDLSITITSDPDTFLFPVAFATFNNSGKLTNLVGLDAIEGLKGDSVVLGGIFGHLFGLFTDADYYSDGDDGHTMTYSLLWRLHAAGPDAVQNNRYYGWDRKQRSQHSAALDVDHDAVRSHRPWCYRLPRNDKAVRGEHGRLRVSRGLNLSQRRRQYRHIRNLTAAGRQQGRPPSRYLRLRSRP